MLRFATIILFAAGVAVTSSASRADESMVELKAGAGQETVQGNCAVCHSLDYIRANSVFLSMDGWKAEVTKMRSIYGAPIDDATAEEILHYLAANYGTPAKK